MSFTSKYLSPCNDIAFKKIFGSEKNEDILIAMLNAVLKNQLPKPITHVQFLNPVQEPEILDKKESLVDVLCRDEDGNQYIIEMQVAYTIGFEERALYYAEKAFVSQMNKGDAYENLKKVIFVAFCDYPIFEEEETYKCKYFSNNDNTVPEKLDKMTFTFVNLVKFGKNIKKPINELTFEEKIYYFLRFAHNISEKDLEQLTKDEPLIKKMFEVTAKHYWSEEELFRYEREQKREWDNNAIILGALEKGMEKGIEQGMEKGLAQGIEQTIKKLIAKGLISQEVAKEYHQLVAS